MSKGEPCQRLGPTARWTAAVRAWESARSDRLFADPWAEAFANEEGRRWLTRWATHEILPIALRTRFFDDFLSDTAVHGEIRQVVLMAAGFDARAFRLSWPAGTAIFELDQASVLRTKEDILNSLGASPSCMRRTIEVNLTKRWQADLLESGFDPKRPCVWLLEGLLYYLPNNCIDGLLERLTELSAPGSRIGFDVVDGAMLISPWSQRWMRMQAEAGAPWVGTMDDPEEALKKHGWQGKMTQVGHPDANYGRWPYPVLPVRMPFLPHHWLVTGRKE